MKKPISPLLPNFSFFPHSYSCPCLWRGWHLEALIILFSCSPHFAGWQILPFVIYTALFILSPRALGPALLPTQLLQPPHGPPCLHPHPESSRGVSLRRRRWKQRSEPFGGSPMLWPVLTSLAQLWPSPPEPTGVPPASTGPLIPMLGCLHLLLPHPLCRSWPAWGPAITPMASVGSPP